MYLVVHGVAGMVIGKQITNPLYSFIVSFIAHFFLDIIPHDNVELEKWMRKGQEKGKFMVVGCLDVLLLIIIMILFDKNHLTTAKPSITTGILGGLLPDLIWTFGVLIKTKNRLAVWFREAHIQIHRLLYKKSYVSNFISNSVQLFFLILFVVGFVLL
jgi:putative flippase GtrA